MFGLIKMEGLLTKNNWLRFPPKAFFFPFIHYIYDCLCPVALVGKNRFVHTFLKWYISKKITARVFDLDPEVRRVWMEYFQVVLDKD